MTSGGARRTKTRIALAMSGVILALISAEIVCRIDAIFPNARFDSEKARLYFELRARRAGASGLARFAAAEPGISDGAQQPMPHPWSGWSDPAATALIETQLEHDRGPEADRDFDIVIVGGSVAAQVGNASAPSLTDALSELPALRGRAVRVWNHGHAAYKAPQPANMVAWLCTLGARPDAVILLDGFNEVAIACSNAENGIHPLHPFADYWTTVAADRAVDLEALDRLVDVRSAQRAEEDFAQAALAFGAHRSALATRLSMRRSAALHRRYESASARYLDHTKQQHGEPALHGPRFETGRPEVLAAAVRAWSESARALDAVCRARSIPLVHALQPTLHDAGSKPLSAPEERDSGAQGAWIEAARLGYPLLREAARALADSGVVVDDATGLFRDERERIYIDVCHYDARGCRLVAQELARLLAQRVR